MFRCIYMGSESRSCLSHWLAFVGRARLLLKLGDDFKHFPSCVLADVQFDGKSADGYFNPVVRDPRISHRLGQKIFAEANHESRLLSVTIGNHLNLLARGPRIASLRRRLRRVASFCYESQHIDNRFVARNSFRRYNFIYIRAKRFNRHIDKFCRILGVQSVHSTM